MKAFVLILYVYASYGSGAATMVTAEFSSQKSCDTAGKMSAATFTAARYYVYFVCAER